MSHAWHLVSRPHGLPSAADFALRQQSDHDLAEGEVRVRNSWLSVDPYMRGRMAEGRSYIGAFKLDAPMEGGAVGHVVESKAAALRPGDRVFHMLGWRDEATAPAAAFTKLPDGPDDSLFLSLLGLTGATAWIGLLKVAEAREGETVFVSAAGGAVGSAVVQIARLRGMHVIGSAGGPDKCAYVRSLGADAVIDYRLGNLTEALADAAPDGIDVYFDNVGGEHLDAALGAAKQNARFALCGMIAGYNGGTPPTFASAMNIIKQRIRLQGFIYTDWMAEMPAFQSEMAAWIAQGKISQRQTVHEGLAAMPDAFLALFSGGNTGKMLVRL